MNTEEQKELKGLKRHKQTTNMIRKENTEAEVTINKIMQQKRTAKSTLRLKRQTNKVKTETVTRKQHKLTRKNENRGRVIK